MIKYFAGENFEDLTKRRVLVDFYADWCGPCKMLGEVIEEISNDINIDILKVDIDKYQQIAKEYGVMSIPSLFIFENGKVIKQSVGFMDKNKLNNFIK